MSELTICRDCGGRMYEHAARCRRPIPKVESFISVEHVRGEGKSEADPVRIITTYYRMDGSPAFEVDPYLGASEVQG